jgi:hypothetical protein
VLQRPFVPSVQLLSLVQPAGAPGPKHPFTVDPGPRSLGQEAPSARWFTGVRPDSALVEVKDPRSQARQATKQTRSAGDRMLYRKATVVPAVISRQSGGRRSRGLRNPSGDPGDDVEIRITRHRDWQPPPIELAG